MRKISETVFALVDCETTGKDPKTAELVEVAAVLIDGRGVIYDRIESFCRPTKPIPPDVMSVHNITNRDVANAPDRATVDEQLRAFIPAEATMVAHFAQYDRAVLEPGIGVRPWICTQRLAHHLMPDALNFKLGTLRYVLSEDPIDTEGLAAHRALADVLVLKFVFRVLIEAWAIRCMDAHEPFDDLGALLALAASPYEIRRFPFGKHRGALLANIPAEYFDWALRNMTDIDADLRWNIERELERRDGRRLIGAVS